MDPAGKLVSSILGDRDRLLIFAILLILYKQGADRALLIALLYIGLDF
ncbi:MAG: hypothetical protein NC084_09205 [Bacteroides sp.]|nr:hypothetical protein [Eubacterium sp.]MCM1419005.1 hypothetical protein [Roseburia sp.]MCM1462873.1 hypothetical protein [Bacteroides sp.]